MTYPDTLRELVHLPTGAVLPTTAAADGCYRDFAPLRAGPGSGRRRSGWTASSRRRCSVSATVARTASAASGFTEMEEIPRRTKCSAKAGRADGACPQSDELIPASWQAAMTRSIASSTAG